MKKNNRYEELKKSPKLLQKMLQRLFDPSKMTTPAALDENVLGFCKKINTHKAPIYLASTPELWSRQSCCDLNVKKYIEYHGGKILCGYKIWYNPPIYIEGERHAVWTDGTEIKDVCFNADGEKQIVFIEDVAGKTETLEQNEHKVRYSIEKDSRDALRLWSHFDKLSPTPRMTNEDSWATMLTYEEWLTGKRMSNSIARWDDRQHIDLSSFS